MKHELFVWSAILFAKYPFFAAVLYYFKTILF